uniref:Reverse transcriptase Ty1/copia-type domain-containing protein n=1 Tax=Solanum lycopersicum TaxID=4081 RepID=A0A3Q7IVQ6_SOLLC
MTHSESVKPFEDIEHPHVLEDKHRDASKAIDQAFLVESVGTSNPKQKKKSNKAWKKKGVPYSSETGSLMYAMLCTHPNICYAVGLVSHYQSNLGQAHWEVVKRILRYLRGTVDYKLCYLGSDLQLMGYSDADGV